MISHSQNQVLARGDSRDERAGVEPYVLIARGDPGRKIEFAADLLEIANNGYEKTKPVNMQATKRKAKRICATWPRYEPPDPEDPDHLQYVKFREWAARKKAWRMACKSWHGLRGDFIDMDIRFFSIKDPTIPKAMYASDRTFVLDSGASYHLIGYNKLTEKEKATIRPVDEPFRVQSANGTITVEEEAQIHVPALNIWIWAQLVEDCPAVLSLGTLCGKQGWSYEWKMETILLCLRVRRVSR